jgi:hypothetical protein
MLQHKGAGIKTHQYRYAFPLRLARFEGPTNDRLMEIITEYFLCYCAESDEGWNVDKCFACNLESEAGLSLFKTKQVA